MKHEPWEVDFDALCMDVTNYLEDGPLEHVANLETIVTDALIANGFPGVLRLLHHYRNRIDELEKTNDRLLGQSMAPAKNGECSTCSGTTDLLETKTLCMECFIHSYKTFTEAQGG